MKKIAAILGLSGAGLVIIVAAALTVVFGAQLLVTFVWVVVPAVIGSCVLSVAVMALVAVSYTETHPRLSTVLYFVAAGLGLVVLWVTGQLLIGGAVGNVPMLAVVPLIAAGVLMYVGHNRRAGPASSNTAG